MTDQTVPDSADQTPPDFAEAPDAPLKSEESGASKPEKGSRFTLNISKRLMLGFAGVCAILAVAVGISIFEVDKIAAINKRVVELRMPTAAASEHMVTNLKGTLAALRGWMLTGNSAFKKERAATWADIDQTVKKIDKFSVNWTVPANKKKWAEFKEILAQFRAAQDKVEGIAKSADEQPATKLLVTEAAPRAVVMVEQITAMINIEATLEATPQRKALLGMMADVRGTTGLALANIRAFLLTGDAKFKEGFDGLWAKNTKRFADLSGQAHLLTAKQRTAFDEFSAAREEFSPLPPKMFEIRGSKRWNMANYTLVTEAAPRAGKLLTILIGPKQEDGSRKGGMVGNQRGLLQTDAADASAEIDQLTMIEWLLLAIGLTAGGVIAVFTARAIVKPAVAMTDVMGKLADGNFDVEIPAQDRHDEIGDMAKAVVVFRENGIKAKELAEVQKQEEARKEKERQERQAEQEKRAQRAQEIQDACNTFDQSVSGVIETVSSASTELQSTAETMSSTAEQTTQQATTVAAASEEASTNVQTVASAAEEMSSSVDEIGRQVSQSTEIAGKAVSEAQRTNETVQGLAEAAQKIGEVVNLISDIAEQTNLLALNATIEAARAGDAGKGFAVVASEVKSLANQTAKATEEIASQIGSMQSVTGEAVEAIKGIGSTIEQISEIATAISAAVEEQGAATQEIARNVQEASKGTSEVSSNITGVNQAASETGAAAKQVLDATGQLSRETETLKDEVAKFLTEIRAA